MAKGIHRVALALFATAAVLAGSAGSALAYETGQSLDSNLFAIEQFETSTSSAEAGARTDFRNFFEMKRDIVPGGIVDAPYGRLKKVELDLPPGLTGDPTSLPTCTREVFMRFMPNEWCPPNTVVGEAEIEAVGVTTLTGFVYNLEPGPDEPALFGIKPGAPLYTLLRIEVDADGELTAIADENPISSGVMVSDVTMWAVPADKNPFESGLERHPFMSNPTNCSEPFTTDYRAEAYEHKHDSATFSEPARTDCGKLEFKPSMSVAPTSSAAGEPTGLDLSITVPQNEEPNAKSTPHVKDVTMTFPEGMTTSAASAAGLGSCAPQEFGYHEETPITCPQNSKIGEVEVDTHILDEPLKGPVYVAKQDDNPFNSLLALYMAPSGSGVTIKLAGKVDLDPASGRLTTRFLNNPQQPFTELKVRLTGGPRAPLALPRACGSYTTTAELTSWAGHRVPLSSSFSVDQGCGRQNQFTPGFSAGPTSSKAGAFSPFTMRITRADAAQANVSSFEATLPEGLLAKLAGVPLCSNADAAAANCPETSKVGHTTVGVGPGSSPVFAPEPGKAPTALYLGGPYNGGPYSIIAEVPAQAGPFDLGTVVLRNALRVNPRTAQVTAIADPLPQFLQGIPISYRDIRVDVDRPNFTLNPTDCEPMSTRASIASNGGPTVNLVDGFRATGCRALGFKPRLALRLKGGTKRSGHPALTAVMNARPGDANIGRVSVALPRSEFLAQDHIRTVCTRVQFAANQCPERSIYGHAEATTPLLDQNLAGPVYLRSSDNPLPDLVAHLKGPIDIELVGRIDSVNSGIRTTFDVVPDAPVNRFTLRMQGGKKSLLENSRDVCIATYRATVEMDGQNGREHDFRPALKHAGCRGAKKKSAAKRSSKKR